MDEVDDPSTETAIVLHNDNESASATDVQHSETELAQKPLSQLLASPPTEDIDLTPLLSGLQHCRMMAEFGQSSLAQFFNFAYEPRNRSRITKIAYLDGNHKPLPGSDQLSDEQIDDYLRAFYVSSFASGKAGAPDRLSKLIDSETLLLKSRREEACKQDKILIELAWRLRNYATYARNHRVEDHQIKFLIDPEMVSVHQGKVILKCFSRMSLLRAFSFSKNTSKATLVRCDKKESKIAKCERLALSCNVIPLMQEMVWEFDRKLAGLEPAGQALILSPTQVEECLAMACQTCDTVLSELHLDDTAALMPDSTLGECHWQEMPTESLDCHDGSAVLLLEEPSDDLSMPLDEQSSATQRPIPLADLHKLTCEEGGEHRVSTEAEIVTSKLFPGGDMDILSASIAAAIFTHYITKKGVPADVLCVVGKKSRQEIGISDDPHPSMTSVPKCTVHYVLDDTERKSVVAKCSRTGKPCIVASKFVIQIDDMHSKDFRDAKMLTCNWLPWNVDEAGSGTAFFRASIIVPDELLDEEGKRMPNCKMPHVDMGKRKLMLADQAHPVEKADMLFSRELNDLFHSIQNDVKRMLCFCKIDSYMFQWKRLCDTQPSVSSDDVDSDASHGSSSSSSDDAVVVAARATRRVARKKRGNKKGCTTKEKDRRKRRVHALVTLETCRATAFLSMEKLRETNDFFQWEMDKEQLSLFRRLRSSCCLFEGQVLVHIPEPPCDDNAGLNKGGGFAFYGPHDDKKNSLNTTALHPLKTLHDGTALHSAAKMPVCTAACGFHSSVIGTSLQHGNAKADGEGGRKVAHSNLIAGTCTHHMQVHGLQTGLKHWASNVTGQKPHVAPDKMTFPHLPREFLLKCPPRRADGSAIVIADGDNIEHPSPLNNRVVSTPRHAPLPEHDQDGHGGLRHGLGGRSMGSEISDLQQTRSLQHHVFSRKSDVQRQPRRLAHSSKCDVRLDASENNSPQEPIDTGGGTGLSPTSQPGI